MEWQQDRQTGPTDNNRYNRPIWLAKNYVTYDHVWLVKSDVTFDHLWLVKSDVTFFKVTFQSINTPPPQEFFSVPQPSSLAGIEKERLCLHDRRVLIINKKEQLCLRYRRVWLSIRKYTVRSTVQFGKRSCLHHKPLSIITVLIRAKIIWAINSVQYVESFVQKASFRDI